MEVAESEDLRSFLEGGSHDHPQDILGKGGLLKELTCKCEHSVSSFFLPLSVVDDELPSGEDDRIRHTAGKKLRHRIILTFTNLSYPGSPGLLDRTIYFQRRTEIAIMHTSRNL